MEVAARSSRPASPASVTAPSPARASTARPPAKDLLELPARPTPPQPKRPWRSELEGAWYITKLMTLTAISNTLAAVVDGWDCLRAKMGRSPAN